MTNRTKQRILYNALRRRFRHQFHVAIPPYVPYMHNALLFAMMRFCAMHQEEIRRSNHHRL